jgi:hypothetical protein
MRVALVVSWVVIAAFVHSSAEAKSKQSATKPYFYSPPVNEVAPPDLSRYLGIPLRSAAVADTFELAWFDFDTNGHPDTEGWMSIDKNRQIDEFFHVAGPSELDGGTYGRLLPLEGSQSVWCGVVPGTGTEICRYATLPGYGNGWDQYFVSKTFSCDSVSLSYEVFWDSEGGYDATVVEYTFDGGSTWFQFAVTDTLSTIPGAYDNTGLAPFNRFVFASRRTAPGRMRTVRGPPTGRS